MCFKKKCRFNKQCSLFDSKSATCQNKGNEFCGRYKEFLEEEE